MVPSVPTYDYQCRQCGRTIEVIHSMLEDGPSTCEHCGGQLRRVLHPAGIIFKGSGFYRNDSRAASTSGESDGGPKSGAVKGAQASTQNAESGKASDSPKVSGSEGASTSSKE